MMRVLAAVAIGMAFTAQSATAQSSFSKDRTLGSIMHGDPERRKNVLIGLAESFSKAYPTLRLSLMTKCLEDAADLPANWTKDVGPFAKECAEKQR